MHRTLAKIAAAVSIVFAAVPAAAQSGPQPPAPVECAKVRPVTTSTDIPALQADVDCFGKVEKAWDAVADNARAEQASARQSRRYREKRIAAVRQMPPEPTPAPKLVAVGDSITHWSGDYSDIYTKAHPSLAYEKIAVGGAKLGKPADRGTATNTLWAQIDQVIAAKPTVVTVLIGANGVLDWFNKDDDVSAWMGNLLAYADALRQATGAKIIVGTILPRCGNTFIVDGQDALFEARRLNANAEIREEVGKSIDGVLDFAANSTLGLHGAACDKSHYIDGLHPTVGLTYPSPTGQQIMAGVYAPVLDAVLARKDAPKPTAPPPPATDTPTVQEHSFAEFLPVAPNYDRASMLVPAHNTGAIPPSNAPDVVGAFRLICAPSHLSYDDPIVYAGEPGKSHLHLFFGNSLANGNSTYKSLRTTGDSTCGALNRSAYWMPALKNGDKVILPDYVTVYYKRRPASDPDCALGGDAAPKGCIGLPRGLRYVFGRTMDGGKYADERTDGVNFICVGQGMNLSNADYATVAKGCPVGAQFVVQLAAPNCWNGTVLVSDDHRSQVRHTVFQRNTAKEICPAGFGYRMPDFHFNVSWTFREEMRDAKFSSDVMMGKPAGSTVHADWFGAWDDATLAAWMTNCIDGFKNASGGDLCNGQQIRGAAQPSYGFYNPSPVVDAPAPGTTEVVG